MLAFVGGVLLSCIISWFWSDRVRQAFPRQSENEAVVIETLDQREMELLINGDPLTVYRLSKPNRVYYSVFDGGNSYCIVGTGAKGELVPGVGGRPWVLSNQ